MVPIISTRDTAGVHVRGKRGQRAAQACFAVQRKQPKKAEEISTMQWIQVAPAENIPPRQGRELCVGDLSIAVFNVGDRYLALENRCPHSGDPLADGTVVDTTVTCELHHWRICLETGLVVKPCIEGTPQVRTFPVEVRDGVVMLGVEAVQSAARC